MIDFRPITLEDRERVTTSICASGCHGADYNFANLYIWRHEYKPLIAFLGDRMVIHMPSEGYIYSYPKGSSDLQEAVEAIRQDAHERGNKLVMRGLTPLILEEFEPLFGEDFEIEENRDEADYVYTTEKLHDLAGRKLSSKRNHIKHFEKNGEWEFVRISGDDTKAAEEFVARFYEEKGDDSLQAESIAIHEMFENFDALGFMGGLLYQNGEPVAFTAGTKLDDITMDVHFEKALPGVDGAYTMVNREFVRSVAAEHPEIEYFNREEDMGIEGLRKAKLSYRPDVLIMKYTAYEK